MGDGTGRRGAGEKRRHGDMETRGRGDGAADKAAIKLVKVQPHQLSMNGCVAIPQLGEVTNQDMRGENGPAAS